MWKNTPHSKYAKEHTNETAKADVSNALKKVKPSAISDLAKALKQGTAKSLKGTAPIAQGIGILGVLGPIGGALKAAKIGAVLGALVPSMTIGGGLVSGAALGAAVGAAPAALFAIFAAGVMAHDIGKNVKRKYKELRTAESSDADFKTVETFIHSVLDHIKENGISPEQAEQLAKAYNLKPE